MEIARRGRPPLVVSYELNAHPGQTLAQLRTALEEHVLPLRRALAPGRPFAIAPRVGRGLLADLARPRPRREFREYLDARALRPVTANAFPVEDFHARRVKERVYAPPWTRSERARLTRRAADLLADLSPPGSAATISTLGGTYRPWGDDARARARMAGHYLDTVAHLARLEREREVSIVLAVEPEPDTTLETAADVIRLRDEFTRPLRRDRVSRPLGISDARAQALVARHFAVNLDVCHQSVLFENPVAAWRTLEAAGLRVAKLHVTSALALPRPARAPAALAELLDLAEPRYLHQVAGRRREAPLARWPDLDALRRELRSARRRPAARARALRDVEELRAHFHVPVSAARLGRLRTTRSDTVATVEYACAHPDPPQLVVETYTWPLIAPDPAGVRAGVRRELRWLLGACGTR